MYSYTFFNSLPESFNVPSINSCKLLIAPDENSTKLRFLKIKDHSYHVDCVRCFKCFEKLNEKSVFKIGDNFLCKNH